MFEIISTGWLAGIMLSLTTGPLGLFIVWRRMSSFGDTLSHSSLLGLAVSVAFNISSFYGIFFIIIFLAFFLACLEELLPFSIETILSIISHSFLSLGMICISLMSTNQKINITNYLFGDLLSVTKYDLIFIIIGCTLILSILIYYWNSILSATISEELAQIDGINVFYIRLTLMLMTALIISIAIKFVGALLITSLLIIPPATAQCFSGSPEKMAIIATLVSFISVTGGILLSFFYSTPASPSVVLLSAVICLLSNIKKYLY